MLRSLRQRVLVASLAGALLCGPVAVPPPAQAQTAMPAVAMALGQALDMLLEPTNDTKAAPGSTFVWKGSTKAEAKEDRYVLQLPALTVNLSDGRQVEVGTVRANLVPTPDGKINIDAVLPKSMPVFKPDGMRDGTLSVGSQSLTGTWAPGLAAELALNLRLGDVKLLTGAGARSARSLGMKANFTSDKSGRWKGMVDTSMENFSSSDAERVQQLTVGNSTAHLTLGQLDLAEFLRRSRSIPANASQSASLDALQGILGDASLKIATSNLKTQDTNTKEAVALADSKLALTLKGLTSGSASMETAYSHTGMKSTRAGVESLIAPRDVDFRIIADTLPNAALWQSFMTYLKNADKMGAEKADSQFRDQVLADLGKAKSQVRVESFRVSLPSASGFLSGFATFDQKAKRGFVSDISMVWRDLAKTAKAVEASTGRIPDIDTVSLLFMLGRMQQMGQNGMDTEGRTLHAYQIKVEPSGNVLVNDENMTSLVDKVWQK